MLDDWKKKRKIARLPGVAASPETILAQILECARAGRLKGVVISLHWDSEDYTVACSDMNTSELSLHALNLQSAAIEVFTGDSDRWEETTK